MLNMLSGFITMMYGAIPTLILKNYVTFSSLFTFIPFIIGVVGVNGYIIKRNKDYKEVFSN